MFESLKEKFSGFLESVTTKSVSEKDIEKFLWDFRVSLLENDVSFKVTEKLEEDLKRRITGEKLSMTSSKKEYIEESLRESVRNILRAQQVSLEEIIERNRKEGRPTVILFLGFNGTGKTTTIAKLAFSLKKKYRVIIAASDTFRAGAIEQLEKHAAAVGVKVIRHDYGADPAAVAFDAVAHAKSKGIEVVLIDTAGRAETNRNLMEQMRKIKRVANPDLTIFVGDALAGNAAVEQAEKFGEVGIDASILTKIDADARGGASLSISYITGKPIIYVCDGQGYEHIRPFDVEWMVGRLV